MDFEKRIKSEFDNMKVDAYIPYRSQVKIKPHLKRSVVILAAVMVFMTTGITAAATGLFGLRQLEEIVGEARTGMLDVVEFVNLEGSTSSSITTDCGLRIGLIATGIHGNIADFYMMLDDSQNRLCGQFYLNHTMSPISGNPLESSFSVSYTQFLIIDRNLETGIITLNTRHTFSVPIKDMYLDFTLHSIYYDSGQVIDIGWQTQIKATSVGSNIIINELNIPLTNGEGEVNEITITPVSMLIKGTVTYTTSDGPLIFQCDWDRTNYCCMKIILHMHDGSQIKMLAYSAGGPVPEYGEIMFYHATFVPYGVYIFDVHEVVAVEILGEVIRISNYIVD